MVPYVVTLGEKWLPPEVRPRLETVRIWGRNPAHAAALAHELRSGDTGRCPEYRPIRCLREVTDGRVGPP